MTVYRQQSNVCTLAPWHHSFSHSHRCGWELGSYLVNTGAVSVKLQSTELGLWPGVCVGGMRGHERVSNHTLDVLLDHLRD